MGMFQQVEGEACILSCKGVYRQCDLYIRDGFLYAKTAGGFVRLMADGATTKAHTRLDHMTWNGPLHRDTLGRLCAPMPGTKAIDTDRSVALLGAPQ